MKNTLQYVSLFVFVLLCILAYEGVEPKIKAYFAGDDYVTYPATPQISPPLQESMPENAQNERDEPASMGRDPLLTGRWLLINTHKSESLNRVTYLYIFPDGTIKQTSQTYGSLGGTPVVYDPEEDPEINNMMQQGIRWFTQNGKIYFLDANGNTRITHDYYFDKYLFIKFYGARKSTAYQSAN